MRAKDMYQSFKEYASNYQYTIPKNLSIKIDEHLQWWVAEMDL
jgi:hypothetical protein